MSYGVAMGQRKKVYLHDYGHMCTMAPWPHTFNMFLCVLFQNQKANDNETTLKCLSIGTPKIINFPFVSNGKFMFFPCPNIHAHYNEAVLCLNFGNLKIMNFPFETNGKFIIFRCPNT